MEMYKKAVGLLVLLSFVFMACFLCVKGLDAARLREEPVQRLKLELWELEEKAKEREREEERLAQDLQSSGGQAGLSVRQGQPSEGQEGLSVRQGQPSEGQEGLSVRQGQLSEGQVGLPVRQGQPSEGQERLPGGQGQLSEGQAGLPGQQGQLSEGQAGLSGGQPSAGREESRLGIADVAVSGQRVIDFLVLEQKYVYLLPDEELDVLLRIVEAEAGVEDEDGKLLVANVVLNRMLDGQFPDTVTEVVFQKENDVAQFSPVADGSYQRVQVSDETIRAVGRALTGEDLSQGALYFAARKYADSGKMKWFDENLTFLFLHGGHEFFK